MRMQHLNVAPGGISTRLTGNVHGVLKERLNESVQMMIWFGEGVVHSHNERFHCHVRISPSKFEIKKQK